MDLKKGIYGSEVAAIMGISKEETIYSIFLKKKNNGRGLKSEKTYLKNKILDLIANEFTVRTGLVTRKENRNLCHKDYSFIIRNTNRRVIGENSILKCMIKNVYGNLEEKDVLSCLHELSMTKAKKCYLAILVGYKKLIIEEIIRDEEKIKRIIKSEVKFWREHVENDISPVSKDNDTFYFSNEDENLINKYMKVKGKYMEYKKEFLDLEKEILEKMGQANRGIINDYLVDFKNIINYKINGNALKENFPDTFNKVARKIETRSMQVRNNRIM